MKPCTNEPLFPLRKVAGAVARPQRTVGRPIDSGPPMVHIGRAAFPRKLEAGPR